MSWSPAYREQIRNSRIWVEDDSRKAGGYWFAESAPEHGTKTGYSNWFCRCTPCTAANTAEVARVREERRTQLVWMVDEREPDGGYWRHPNPDLEHGKYSTYRNWHCRCHSCRHGERIEQYQKNHPSQSEDGNGDDL